MYERLWRKLDRNMHLIVERLIGGAGNQDLGVRQFTLGDFEDQQRPRGKARFQALARQEARRIGQALARGVAGAIASEPAVSAR